MSIDAASHPIIVAPNVMSNARPRRVASVPRCIVYIALVKLALRAIGFGRAVRLVTRRSQRPPRNTQWSPLTAQRGLRAVATAAALYPGRALCLEQSLVLYYILRLAELDVRLRIGVQPNPLNAHAWVEHAGEPLNDFPEHIRRFVPLPGIDQ